MIINYSFYYKSKINNNYNIINFNQFNSKIKINLFLNIKKFSILPSILYYLNNFYILFYKYLYMQTILTFKIINLQAQSSQIHINIFSTLFEHSPVEWIEDDNTLGLNLYLLYMFKFPRYFLISICNLLVNLPLSSHLILFNFLKTLLLESFEIVKQSQKLIGFVFIFKGKLGAGGLQRYASWRFKYKKTALYRNNYKSLHINKPGWTITGSLNVIYKLFWNEF